MEKITLTLNQIFTKEHLLNIYNSINKTNSGIDEVTFSEFESNLENNIEKLLDDILNKNYAPEPLLSFELNKDDKKRPIAISSIKDKIVQKTLYNEIYPYFEKIFSNKSYAYRIGKSPLKAINRVRDFINKGDKYILKTDIHNFFETINHNKLISILKEYINDIDIINLIMLFLKIGRIKKLNYIEHNIGVYQGDIISPLLSNIYLDKMDKFIEKNNFNFVRFADDFIILSNKNILQEFLPKLEQFLESLDLKLNKEKTYFSSVDKYFSFLGVAFNKNQVSIENERFNKVISKLHLYAKEPLGITQYIKKLNSYLEILEHYYFKIINSTQKNLLQEHLISSISQKFFYLKKAKKINKAQMLKEISNIKLSILFQDYKKVKNQIISLVYTRLKYKDVNRKINLKKQEYSKKLSVSSTLHIINIASSLGVSKGKFIIKEKGKIIHSQPVSKTSHIIIETPIYSISSKVIQECAKNNIHIDFIDKNLLPFAQLTFYNSSTTQLIHKQALILNTPKQFELAKEFIDSKARNQLNYIKYQNRYYKNLNNNIDKIESLIKKLNKHSKTINELMGYEGQISNIYWDSIKINLDYPFEKRVTLGAKDLVNSSLNYAYAILYNKVQYYLIQAGLSLHISFLHSLNSQKPTLTFDMIEEFRTFIVDRVVFAMINKNEHLEIDKNGFLTNDSKILIARNIKEKLGSYTTWKKQSIKVENIIKIQAYNLKSFILDNTKYNGFIGKY